MRNILLTASVLTLLGACASPGNVTSSPRPRPGPVNGVGTEAGMQAWIADFRPRAERAGISPATLNLAFADVHYNAEVVSLDGRQSEFTKTVWQYLDGAVSADRIAQGRAMLSRHAATLNAIEARYGVDKEIVVAIWGMESNFGGNRGRTHLIESLTTLAYHGRRAEFFETQLLDALKIVQAGDVTPANMVGSWAGAMGHTQFMPSSFLESAVDFNGDGRRDIWSDDPTDALASTANYLAKAGWQRGGIWGMEVTLPPGFNYSGIGKGNRLSSSAWAAQGVRSADGRAFPQGEASILLPGGAKGAAFLIFQNFRAIERYNAADSYVIGVGHLADRLKGLGPIRNIPANAEPPLSRSQTQELQERLTRRGYDTQGTDGRVGPNTVSAITAYQRSAGLIPDGYASASLLASLR
ncbi:lytic murein transglycosylase [Falsirhodobacter sp. 20TX0035]|uniref:lytic murein transglycosylase n=1 Tax=Falsirhodobacter sp. 20TX0035 TaxID=3022019 RepID=UPI00232F67F0|nr:lytic murein transglycosylase [Falsirhodobacter sp. 20TX0035]MDB6453966.1 lytic murein transglycosylase [Falsirhodobacter sp. 20TX0035]